MTEDGGLQYHALLHDDLETVRTLMLSACESIPQPIQRPIKLLIDRGGKRLRPALVLLFSHIAGADQQQALYTAAGVEMLHTATLVHDDLIDEAKVRRGVETLNNHWSATSIILAGDTMFALAAKLIARSDNNFLVYRFSETLEAICAGELRQMLSRNGGVPTIESYYDRIFAKTASLFALCAESGPILGHSDERAVAAARAFGRRLGEAFQIADDVLDIIGDPQQLGKPAGSDLRQGLVTLPIILYARDRPKDNRLQSIIHSEADKTAIVRLVAEIQTSQAPEDAMARAEAHIQEALALLEHYPDTPYRRALVEIAHFAVRRRY